MLKNQNKEKGVLMIKMKYSILILLFIYSSSLFSQLSIDGKPASFRKNSHEITIPVVNVTNNSKDITLSDKKFPKQAGYTIPFPGNLDDLGKWHKTKDENIWICGLSVKNENSLNLYFIDFDLKDYDYLYIYSPDRTIVHGAFSDINNGDYFATDFIPGDSIIIEFNTKRKTEKLPFTLSEIGILVNGDNWQRGFGDAGSCEVHVNCPEGENWQDERNGVVRILLKDNGGTFWCTGSLVNNTKNDGKPYLLTANHCGQTSDSSDYLQWLFYFNFQSENCEQPLLQPEYLSLTGASLLARSISSTSSGSDFKLLKLNNIVPNTYAPYYNGWDITGTASQSGVCIHHPQGDVKMISTYKEPLISSNYYGSSENPNGLFWKVYWAETENGFGVTEGGSSGSPIFNDEGYIVGTLTGGNASCIKTGQPDYYGKFSNSWQPASSDSSGQLSYWLDPIGLGVTKLEGTNLDSTTIYAGFSADKQSVLLGNEVTFINTSYGNITSYEWYFEGGIPEYSYDKEPEKIMYKVTGDYDVKLIVSSSTVTDTLIGKDYIKVLPSIAPVPCDGTVSIAFGSEVPDDLEVIGYNTAGKEIPITITATGENYVEISLVSEGLGLYLIKIICKNYNNTYKISNHQLVINFKSIS